MGNYTGISGGSVFILCRRQTARPRSIVSQKSSSPGQFGNPVGQEGRFAQLFQRKEVTAEESGLLAMG
jgi:hypothetical protein